MRQRLIHLGNFSDYAIVQQTKAEAKQLRDQGKLDEAVKMEAVMTLEQMGIQVALLYA